MKNLIARTWYIDARGGRLFDLCCTRFVVAVRYKFVVSSEPWNWKPVERFSLQLSLTDLVLTYWYNISYTLSAVPVRARMPPPKTSVSLPRLVQDLAAGGRRIGVTPDRHVVVPLVEFGTLIDR